MERFVWSHIIRTLAPNSLAYHWLRVSMAVFFRIDVFSADGRGRHCRSLAGVDNK